MKPVSQFTHDLKNPLGVVIAYSQLLSKELEKMNLDPRVMRQIEGIVRAADRMEALINAYTEDLNASQTEASVQAGAVATSVSATTGVSSATDGQSASL